MVKLRQAKYCNLKLFLIFLVVFGHLIEPMGHWLYRYIYAFHIPAFALVSGVFSKKNQLAQAKKLFLWYIILQSIYVLSGKTSIWTPYWHLWYLLSNVCWLLLGRLLARFERHKRLILSCAILTGCAIGMVPQAGRFLSLSRTVVFFPYYWLGNCLSAKKERKGSKIAGGFGALLALSLLFLVEIPTTFFYHASAYTDVKQGLFLRAVCYLIGFAICFFLLIFTPDRRFGFTKMGADTLGVYLFHAPFILLLRRQAFSIPVCALIGIGLIWLFYKIQQMGRYFCGITARKEVGDGNIPTNL